MLSLEATYLQSFALGLFFIGLFAWDRLSEPIAVGRDAVYQRQRFFEILAPSKLLRRAVLFRGWLVYFFLTAIVYFFLCSAGEPAFNVIIKPYLSETGFSDINHSSPEVPLIISLVLIGVLPRFHKLSFFEELSRRVAYQCIGIPKSFLEMTDALYGAELDVRPLGGREIARIEERVEAAVAMLGSDVDAALLRQHLVKISYWKEIVSTGRPWPGTLISDKYKALAEELAAKIEMVIDDVDDLIVRFKPEGSAEHLEERWKLVVGRIDGVVLDICALLAIYLENSNRLPRQKRRRSAGRFGRSAVPARGARGYAVATQDERMDALRNFFQLARKRKNEQKNEGLIIINKMMALSGILFIFGLGGHWLGLVSYEQVFIKIGVDTDNRVYKPLITALVWLVGTIATYGPAMFVAWGIRTVSMERGRWQNFVESRSGVFPGGQLLKVLLSGYLVTVLALGVFTLSMIYITVFDQTLVFTRFWENQYSVNVLLFGALGAVYAVGLTFTFDIYEAYGPRSGALVRAAAIICIALGAVCALASANQYALNGESDPVAWYAAGYQILSTIVFGVAASVLTVNALRKLEEIDQKKAQLRDKFQLIAAG